MRRLVFLAAISLACLSPALAQSNKVQRLAVLAASSRGLDFVRAVTLPELQTLGYVEGQNLVVEMRTGPPAELSGLARALVASSPSVIVALDGVSVTAAQRETTHGPNGHLLVRRTVVAGAGAGAVMARLRSSPAKTAT
ncbi:MAG TPA: hypothetical protein VGU24_20720 [Microvirga sp.]|jgi:hypothetical protein|nr:hypothetical protein [Microvirga sp.]